MIPNFTLFAADETTSFIDWWNSLWFRPQSSTVAGSVDWLFNFVMVVCIFFFVLIIGMLVVFLAKYISRPGHKPEPSPSHNDTLEITWSVIPLIITFFIFYWGFVGYIDMRTPPDDVLEIKVVGKKWAWSFQYPNGAIDADIHALLGQPVRLVMSSDDVIHSLFIPAFRVKQDVVPGRYSKTWFTATKTAPEDNGDSFPDPDEGGFDLFCTEYCGTSHSQMKAKVIIEKSDGDFLNYLNRINDPRNGGAPVEVGATLYNRRGCIQCHSIDGSAKAGPTWKGSYGTEAELATGDKVKVDENYIRESILNPTAKVHKGFNPVMPTYLGQLKDDEIFALIQYIRTLNGVDVEDWPAKPEVPVVDPNAPPKN